MSNIIIRAKSHQEWLDARKGGIGSSEVATILGVNPWQTVYQLWRQKTGQDEGEKPETFLMKAGHYLEDAISRFCADETGVQIIKNSSAEFIVVSKEKPFLRVSPDRYAWKPGLPHTRDNKIIIECKSTQNAIDEDNIPLYWFCQVEHQLGVCEMEEAVIAWLTQGRQFGYKWLTLNHEFFNETIVENVERFWVDNIIGGQEPPLTTVEDVLIKYPVPGDNPWQAASDELVEVYNELKETNAEIKRLKGLKEEAEAKLKLGMGASDTLYLPATRESPQRILATWKKGKDGQKFDEDTFREQNPDIWSKYLIPTQGTRRFNLK